MNLFVIYHGNCADGFTAAWAVWKQFPDAEFYPGFYGEEPPNVDGKTVVMVDFSYKKPVLEKMAESAKAILILDHHKSAAEDLAEYPEPPHSDDGYFWIPDSGIYAVFDMQKSGARLAWEYFHDIAPGMLVMHVEDRDLWRFSMDDTRPFMANLFSFEFTFENWDRINDNCFSNWNDGYRSFVQAGVALERKHLKDVKDLLEVCQRRMQIGGFLVPAASLPYTMASDAGHIMAKGEPFAACYWDTAFERIFSLRSCDEGTDEGVDVSEIAAQYGGGGHRNAAGFKVQRGHELARA